MTLSEGAIPTPMVRGNFATVVREDGTMATLSKKEGKTRGKNPRAIEYEVLDREKPETLPKTLKEFNEVTGVKSESELLELAIDGFNLNQYQAASDEIGEFINDAWDSETQAQFRLAVRNTSKLSGMSIEDVVTMLKPAVEKGWAAKVEAKKAAAAEAAKTAPAAATA